MTPSSDTFIRAVIFDMDGLMIDSEPVHFTAFADTLSEYGVTYLESTHIDENVGISDLDTAKKIVHQHTLQLTPTQLVAAKQHAYSKLLTHVIPKQGLFELLHELRSMHIKIAIASSSMLEEIRTVIQALSIAPQIDAYVSAEQVAKGKPAPDVFLLAAKKLNIQPQNCLVLEDAENGVRAAKAAGMVCFAIPSDQTRHHDFTAADRVLHSLSDVREAMKGLQ